MVSRVLNTGFFRAKQINLYLHMCDGSLKEVAKKAGVTYNYASSLVSRWVAVGILEVRKAGRSFEYRYTAKGLKLRDMFLEYHEAGGKYG